jgi:capsular polysaccharide transport system ATP-binding protein
MIRLSRVRKTYLTRAGARTVLDDVDLKIAYGEKVGILGGNGAGKSTLIRIISGAERPSGGKVFRDMSVSWPLAFGGAFQTSLTGIDNLRFICRIYGVSVDDKLPFVHEFTELGKYLNEPVRTYSAGMRAKLAFAISMAVDFDCFLIDEVTAVGDERFRQKCHVELFGKRNSRAMIFVSHDPGFIRANCQRATVLHRGKLHEFAEMDEAYHFYEKTQRE